MGSWTRSLLANSHRSLSCLSISSPAFFFFITTTAGISNGANVLISNALGKKEYREARAPAYNRSHLQLLWHSSSRCLPERPCPCRRLWVPRAVPRHVIGILQRDAHRVGLHDINQCLFCRTQGSGETKSYRNMLVLGCLLNCMLNPLFMFGGFGIPAMGVIGLALSTSTINLLSAIYLFHRLRRSEMWGGTFQMIPRPDKTWWRIAKQGLPASFNMISMAFAWYIATLLIGKFSNAGVQPTGSRTSRPSSDSILGIGNRLCLHGRTKSRRQQWKADHGMPKVHHEDQLPWSNAGESSCS